jgi:hypothetical protein
MVIRQIEKIEEGLYQISSPFCECGSTLSIGITGEQLFAYNQGELTHNVLPNRTPAEREQFISGTCPECWKSLFG